MADLFEDLRFFIGAFFFIVGAILLVHSIVEPSLVENVDLNFYAGSFFLLFSIGAFVLTAIGWTDKRRARMALKNQG